MERVKLDQEVLGLSSLMERLTGARVKDCFREQDMVYFVVAPGELGKAVGKGGIHVKRVQQELGKKIRIIEFSPSIHEFVRNIIYPLQVEKIIEEDSIILQESNRRTKSLLIGREGRNLKLINRAVRRFFNKEVKVV